MLTRSTSLLYRSRRNTSVSPLVSLTTTLLAEVVNATYRPLPETAVLSTLLFNRAPPRPEATRIVWPVARSRTKGSARPASSPRSRRSSRATRASWSRARAGGSASTATSSARSRSRPPARATSRWPTRTTSGTRTSSRRCWRRSATRGWSTATRASSPATASCSPTPTGARRAQQPRRPAVAARRQRGHGRGVAVPARPARRRAAVPAGPVRALPRPLDRALRAGARRDPRSSTGRSTTTSSTGRRRSATRAANRMTGLRERARRAAPRPARARAAVAHALLRRRVPADPVRDRPAACAAATA